MLQNGTMALQLIIDANKTLNFFYHIGLETYNKIKYF